MESFTTSITYPNDVFAEVVIPGRQRGPLFFSANTITSTKYQLNFELVLKPITCSPPPIGFDGDFRTIPGELDKRIRASIDRRHKYRERVMAVAKVHYNYIRDVFGGTITKIESDTDNWNSTENRYSGSFTFTFGSCQSNDYLTSLTKIFGNADASV